MVEKHRWKYYSSARVLQLLIEFSWITVLGERVNLRCPAEALCEGRCLKRSMLGKKIPRTCRGAWATIALP